MANPAAAISHQDRLFMVLYRIASQPHPIEVKPLARISHTLSAAARDKAASTSLRSLTVLDVLFKYASAR
jgi:hypothetical protein